jgi:methyl-accepting chemotaxis protein
MSSPTYTNAKSGGLDPHAEAAFKERLDFMQIDESARASLRSIKPAIEESLPVILDKFYDMIQRWPDLKKMFSNASHMTAAKNLQVQHWKTIADGRFDKSYVESVLRIGRTHNKIGLEPRWYIGGYAAIVSGIVEALSKKILTPGFMTSRKRDDFETSLSCFLRAALLDMDMAISTYFEANKDEYQLLLVGMTEKFDSSVAGFVDGLAYSTQAMGEVANELKELADNGQANAISLGASTDNAMQNVNSVASASEEMLASIHEINSQIAHSSALSKEAVDQTRKAGTSINELKVLSGKIGEIIGLIQNVAGQTNLLALNATIEAARAGEAGKGFAVVASEVKALAAQTGKATEEIERQISAIQAATETSVKMIENVNGTIVKVSEIASSIAAAVEEQSAAMAEIVRNTQSAAQRTSEVSASVAKVAQSSEATQNSAANISAATNELGTQAEELRGSVEIFLANLKSTQ